MEKQYCNVARYKNKMYIRELVGNTRSKRIVRYKPSLFEVTHENTGWQDFYRKNNLERITFESPFEMKQYLEDNKSEIKNIFGNTDLETQFIYDEGYTQKDVNKILISYIDIEVCTREFLHGEWVDGGFPEATNASFPINAICDYRSDTKKYYVFTTAAGWTPEKSQLSYSSDIVYIYCRTEVELLEKWMAFWEKKYPDIVTGWNNKAFDLVYIINRCKRILGEKFAERISPWGVISERAEKNRFGQNVTCYDILGIATIDYLEVYKKYRLTPRENYTLGYISKCENPDDHKLEFTGTHGELYYKDPIFFIDYNIQDVHCVVRMDDVLQYLPLVIYLSYYSGINFADNFSPIKIWETFIYRTAMDAKVVTPIKQGSVEKTEFEGAYVHTPVPGLKGCIASFDYTSLYPSILSQVYIGADSHVTGDDKTKLFNEFLDVLRNDTDSKSHEMYKEISSTGIFNEFYINNDMPKAVTEFLQKKGVSIATNCEFYDITKESIFVKLVQMLFAERKADKKKSFEHKHKAQEIQEELDSRKSSGKVSETYEKYSDEELIEMRNEAKKQSAIFNVSQNVKKVLLNSLYGAIGNNFFRFYNRDMARSITLMGQFFINKAAIEKNRYIGKMLKEPFGQEKDRRIYSDTDSNYMDLTDVLQKLYDRKPDADRNEATDFIDRFCKKIESDCLAPLFDKIKYECNCYDKVNMHMDREAICIPYKKTGYSAIWVAKKRYCAMVSDMEDYRYPEPYRKIMGMFSVTSSCPEFIKPVYNKVMEDLIKEGIDVARQTIKEFKEVFYSKPVEDIAFPKSVSDVDKYTNPKTGLPWEGEWWDADAGKKRNGGVPVNSKAAICHNYLVKKFGLEKKYQMIKDGDKLKFVWLDKNPLGLQVVGFVGEMPEEFGLREYVSYDLHWEKLFYKPMTDLFEACGLSVEVTLSIDDFF